MTASPQELTLMLYDGAIKFGNQAKIAIENGDIEKAHNSIVKVQNIIVEFRSTLDMQYEISGSLNLLYEYIDRRLFDADMAKDIEALDEAIDFIRELRNTWKEAMQLAKNPSQTVSSL